MLPISNQGGLILWCFSIFFFFENDGEKIRSLLLFFFLYKSSIVPIFIHFCSHGRLPLPFDGCGHFVAVLYTLVDLCMPLVCLYRPFVCPLARL